MLQMSAMYFLQKHQIGAGAAYRFAQLGQDEAPIEEGKTFVHVDRQHVNAMHGSNAAYAAARFV